MAILKIKKKKENKILFGVIIPYPVSVFYNFPLLSEKNAEKLLKEGLKINQNRLVKFIQVENAEGKQLDLLVIYEDILDEKTRDRIKDSLEIKKFNFHIFNFNFNSDEIDVEKLVKQFNK